MGLNSQSRCFVRIHHSYGEITFELKLKNFAISINLNLAKGLIAKHEKPNDEKLKYVEEKTNFMINIFSHEDVCFLNEAYFSFCHTQILMIIKKVFCKKFVDSDTIFRK